MALTKSISPVSKDTNKNQDVDGVLSGKAWDLKSLGGVITYSFPDQATDYGKGYSEATTGFEAFQAAQQQAIRGILASIESLTDLKFQDLTGTRNDGSAVLRFAETDKTVEAWSYYPSEKADGGDSWFNNSSDLFETPTIGSYAYATFMHEVGHTLGLKHSFEKGSFGVVPRDSLEYSVMSYSSYEGSNDWLNAPLDYPQTLMMYDIAALQRMYGADFTKNSGDTVYAWDWQSGAMSASGVKQPFDAPGTDTIFMTIWDGGGIDTYDFSQWQTDIRIDLRPGEWIEEIGTTTHTANLDGKTGSDDPVWADGMVANALTVKTYDAAGNVKSEDTRSLIENAKGGNGEDILVGNQVVNLLTGGAESDTFTWESLQDLSNKGLGLDTITDFSEGDRIDLQLVTALEFADLSVTKDGATQYLHGNIDGVGTPEFSIRVQGSFDLATHWGSANQWVVV